MTNPVLWRDLANTLSDQDRVLFDRITKQRLFHGTALDGAIFIRFDVRRTSSGWNIRADFVPKSSDKPYGLVITGHDLQIDSMQAIAAYPKGMVIATEFLHRDEDRLVQIETEGPGWEREI